MKRRVIVVGIIAIVCFVSYQFFFADSRSRLKVDAVKNKMSMAPPPSMTVLETPTNEFAPEELSVLSQEAHFNESINEYTDADIQSLNRLSTVLTKSDRARQNNKVTQSLRKLIREGVIEFQVEDVVVATRSIDALIKQFNGYVAADREDAYSGGPQHQTVVRIPAESLDLFISKLEPLAKKMRTRNITSKDVTDEYIDLSERLITKRDLEKNYREILTKARKVSEMLEVERELADVRGDIESMQGRIEYINNHVSYSTLTITYHQLFIQTDENTFGQKIANSLVSGWLSVLDFIVDLLYAWPLLVILPPIVWFLFRWAKKRFPETVVVTAN